MEYKYVPDIQVYRNIKKLSNFMSGKPGYVLNIDYTPPIRQVDIDNGTITRYFGRKTNEPIGEILELEETLYNKLSTSSLYLTVKLPWRIAGKIEDMYTGTIRTYTGVVSANILATLDADKQLTGILRKLSDPLQYYQKE